MSGNLLQQALNALNSGALQQAQAICQQLLQQSPGNPGAMLILAHCHNLSGDNTTAIDILRQLLKRHPGNADALNNLAILLEQQGKNEEAIQLYQRAIRAQPKQLSAYNNLGDLYRKSGKLAESIEILNKALKRAPTHTATLNQLALSFHQQGDTEKAIDQLKSALKINPNEVQVLANLGSMLYLSKALDQAIEYSQHALQLNPGNFAALNTVTAALIDQLRLSDAIPFIEKAQSIAPNSPELLDNIGKWHMFSGDMHKALNCFNQALEQHPNHLGIRWHRSFVHLLLGNYQHGWNDYLAGFQSGERITRKFPFTLWQGESLEGKTILIHAEQGIGDEIMFASCFEDVIGQSNKVIIECDERLGPLFERSFKEAEIVAGKRDSNLTLLSQRKDIDFHTPMGNLPVYLRQDEKHFSGKAFLSSDATKTDCWKQRYATLPEPINIGISWRAGKAEDQLKRSLKLEQLLPLLKLPGINFINLQYGDCAKEIAWLAQQGVQLHHWDISNPLHEQDDFAAQIQALDMVISVSNATVHLAGSLGVRTLTLLPFVPSWRWRFESHTTPWYHSVELIRQQVQDDWTGPIELAIQRLESIQAS